MVLLTSRDTGLYAYVDEHDIVSIDTVHAKSCPFSRIYLQNKKENHDFFLDVTEDVKEIKRRIKSERLTPGVFANGYEQ